MNLILATLIPALRDRYDLVVTTTTSTGYALARERLPAEVTLLYFPQDFSGCVRAAFDLIQPDQIILTESEVWPNHVWEAARRNVPVALVNARMSPKSARRHAKVRWRFRHVFSKIALVCAQSRDDAENFRQCGAPHVEMTGNLKYDAALPKPGTTALPVPAYGDRPVLVAGSTWPGEEEVLFELLVREPALRLVFVPRHVERTPEILELAEKMNVPVALRKTDAPAPTDARCLLVNTTGELKAFYDVATVIFVGKSLPGNIGGQNIVEAAASGHPVVFGPNMQNFKAIAAEFIEAGAGIQVADRQEFARVMPELLRDAARRQTIVAAAREVIARNAGATARTIALLTKS